MHGLELIDQHIMFYGPFTAQSDHLAKYYTIVRKEVKIRPTKVFVEMHVVNLPDAKFREKYLAFGEFIKGGIS